MKQKAPRGEEDKMVKFEVGKKYVSESYGSACMFEKFVCVSRTDKTATFRNDYETIKRKIKTYNGEEVVKYDAGYSFIYAGRIAE